MKKKYFPNNWQAISECPADFFPPMEYDDLVDWKIYGYQLPSSHYGIIRTYDKKNGKVKEYSYKSEHYAKQKLKEVIKDDQVTVFATMEGVWHLMKPPIDFNNP